MEETKIPPIQQSVPTPPSKKRFLELFKKINSRFLYVTLAASVLLLVIVLSIAQNSYKPVQNSPITPIGQNNSGNEIPTPNKYDQYQPDYYIPDNGSTIQVVWEKTLVELNTCDNSRLIPFYAYGECEIYMVGVISSGELAGNMLYMQVIRDMYTTFENFVIKDGLPVLLNRDQIKGLKLENMPEFITYSPNNRYQLERGWGSMLFSEIKTRKPFTDPIVGPVYAAIEEKCFAVELPDHTVVSYELKIPFYSQQTSALDITFLLGQKQNIDEYAGAYVRGCHQFCSPLNESLVRSSELIQVAVAKNGDPIYELKDSQHKLLQDLYNDKYTVAFLSSDWIRKATSKYTYQQFLNLHPLLYWHAPQGFYVEFKNSKLDVAAEMCKPVIYFYPRN